jgi:hypothetical protein
MTTLLVRHAHSRFQLRRGTGFTTVVGGVLIALGGAGLLGAIASAPGHFAAMICPSLVALALGFVGLKVLNAGALLLEAEAGGTYVASLDRQVAPQELRGVEVRWRFDGQRDKEVEVELKLESARADVTQGWLPYPDPEGLATQLSTVLGVPVEVDQQASEVPRL